MSTINIDEVIEYYVNLLTIQYNNKERARKTIALYTGTLLKDNLPCLVQDAYNLETAVGVQLDVLGRYIGADRFFTETILVGSFFGFTSYSTLDTDSTVGMTDYADYDTDLGGFATYDDISNLYTLNDDNYRFILKLKIVQNNSNHSYGSIDNDLFPFFGEDLIASSNQDMTMVYFVTAAQADLARIAFEKEVLPRPMGVGVNLLIKKDKKMFGFTNYNRTAISNLTTGFTNYTDGFTKEGEILTYNKVFN